MLNILFWNVQRKDLSELVCQLTSATAADVVVLIESGSSESKTLEALQSAVSASFVEPPAQSARFQLFVRDATLDLHEIHDDNRVSMRSLSYSGSRFLLGIVHFFDRINWDSTPQTLETALLAQRVRDVESRVGHSRTILAGDFNMNPFDPGMCEAQTLNAMMTKRCVERGHRTVQQIEYPFFYNPMWGHFGDRTPGPPGTFHFSSSTRGHHGWNLLDQVLVRPDAIPWFDDVEILDMAGATPLTTELGRPDKSRASDHFPILLKLRHSAE